MKRMLLTLVMLLVACSLTFAQTDKKMNDKGKTTMAEKEKATAMPDKEMGALTDALVAKEKAILDAIMTKDRKAFESIVASDAIMAGAMGRMAIADGLNMLFSADYALTNATIDEPQVMMINKDAAILTYKSTGTDTFQGKSNTTTAYITSVYARRGAEWKAIFHQESTVPPTSAPGGNK